MPLEQGDQTPTQNTRILTAQQSEQLADLFTTHLRTLTIYFYQHGIPTQKIADSIQNTFLKVAQAMAGGVTFSHSDALGAYTAKTARSELITYYRKLHPKHPIPFSLEHEQEENSDFDIPSTEDPSDQFDKSGTSEDLYRALGNLPFPHLTALVMHAQGKTYEDIARATGTEESAMRMFLTRARRSLRREFANEENADFQE